MLFRPDRSREVLRRALCAAVATHRPPVLQHLVAEHGARAVAAALAGGSGRVIADALSMLPPDDRARIRRCLPRPMAGLSSGSGSIR